MASSSVSPVDRFAALLESSGSDVDLESFLGASGPMDDDVLADVIDMDGRARVAAGLAAPLERYRAAVPDLEGRETVLDAAIDAALRSLSGGSIPLPRAVGELERSYPHLAREIREAAALSAAVCSTDTLVRRARGDALPVPSDFGAPDRRGVRRYRLLRLLGSGSQGSVYLAEDRVLSEEGHAALVAVKVIAGEPLEQEELSQQLEEATKARRVAHPNVVRVLDRGVAEDGRGYIVYEYIDGGDLLGKLGEAGGRLGVREGVELIARVARGVHAAHMAGLIHRDLKPGNIMLDAEGTPKVADFGVAKRVTASPGDEEAEGGRVGNVAFMSPEQFLRGDAVTTAADVYSLGAILYYLLSGSLPNGETRGQVARSHGSGGSGVAPARLSQRGVKADADLDAVCARAMARDPDDRHPSASALADDLETWLRREPIMWRRPWVGRRLSLLIRRRPAWAAAVGLLLIALVGTGVVSVSFYRAAEQERVARLIEQAREEERRQATIDSVRNMYRSIQAQRLYGQGMIEVSIERLLAFTQMVQWSVDAAGLDDLSRIFEPWEERIRSAEAVLAGLADGERATFRRIVWESSLAYWQSQAGLYEEAARTASSVRRAASSMFDASDPWLAQLELLEAAAVSRSLLETSRGRALTGPELVRLREAEAALRREDDVFASERVVIPHDEGGLIIEVGAGTALHRFVLGCLVDLYRSDLLRDDALAERYHRKRERYRPELTVLDQGG